MSRTIDMSDPEAWDEDDVRYLRDRGQLPEGHEEPMPTDVTTVPLPETNTGDANTWRGRDEDGANFGGPEDAYKRMTVEQLKQELSLREMPVSGTKNELVYRLLADDSKPVPGAEEEDEDFEDGEDD